MIYCTQCGKPNHDDSRFCSSCGNQIMRMPQTQNSNNILGYNPSRLQDKPYPDPIPIKRKITPSVPGIICSILLLCSCFLPFIDSILAYREKPITFFEYIYTKGTSSLFTILALVVVISSITALVFSIFEVKYGILLSGVVSLVCIIIYIIEFIRYFDLGGIDFKSIMTMIGKDYLQLKSGFYALPILSVALIIIGATMHKIIPFSYSDIRIKTNADNKGKSVENDNYISGWKCLMCGRVNAVYAKRCQCGAEKPDGENTSNRIYLNSSRQRRCPSCGEIADESRTTCSSCGAALIM